METDQEKKVTQRKNLNSYQSDKKDKKQGFCKRARACFRCLSIVEYRTPLYFANKHSYKSATSGILTILLCLIFVISALIIFLPIISMEIFKSETSQIKIRGVDNEGNFDESCKECKNFTVREAIESTFNRNMTLTIPS